MDQYEHFRPDGVSDRSWMVGALIYDMSRWSSTERKEAIEFILECYCDKCGEPRHGDHICRVGKIHMTLAAAWRAAFS